MSLNKRARKGVTQFARVQHKSTKSKYLVSAKTIVDYAVKAYQNWKKDGSK